MFRVFNGLGMSSFIFSKFLSRVLMGLPTTKVYPAHNLGGPIPIERVLDKENLGRG